MLEHMHKGMMGSYHGRGATKSVLVGMIAGSLSFGMVGCSAGTASDDGQHEAVEDSNQSEPKTTTKTTMAVSLKSEAEIPTDGSPLSLIDATDLWSKRDLDPSYDEGSATFITLDGSVATIDDNDGSTESAVVSDDAVTISAEGTYVIKGTTDRLRLVVDAPNDAKVQLVLAGVSINRDGLAGIYAKSADKVFLTVADGTENSVSSVGSFSDVDANVDGTVFSKCDLTVNGTGKLSVSSEEGHGIVCKDDLRLVSSSTVITAAKHAIQAKDSVALHDGIWSLTSGKDGIHSENTDDQTRGWTYVDGGTVTIVASSDGVGSSSWLQIDAGELSIDAADDALHSEFDLAVNGGTIDIENCEEGIEGGTVTIASGEVSVIAKDDGINATGNSSGDMGSTKMGMTGTDGQATQQSPQAPFRLQDHANRTERQSDSEEESQMPVPPQDMSDDAYVTKERPALPDAMGTGDGMAPPESPEGMDGNNRLEPPATPEGEASDGTRSDMGGEMSLPASPDGQGQRNGNRRFPTDGQEPSRNEESQPAGMDSPENTEARTTVPANQLGREPRMAGMMDADDTAILTISGGKVVVDAQGDGIDSNGLLHVTGGKTYVYGPTSDDNSAIDYGTGLRLDGGTLVAVGSSGMVEGVSSDSTQASMTVFLGEATTGSVTVSANGNEVVGCSPTREYSSVLVSAPTLTSDGTYILSTGNASQDIQMSGNVTTIGSNRTEGMFSTGGNGSPRGFSKPEDLVGRKLIGNKVSQEKPDDNNGSS